MATYCSRSASATMLVSAWTVATCCTYCRSRRGRLRWARPCRCRHWRVRWICVFPQARSPAESCVSRGAACLVRIPVTSWWSCRSACRLPKARRSVRHTKRCANSSRVTTRDTDGHPDGNKENGALGRRFFLEEHDCRLGGQQLLKRGHQFLFLDRLGDVGLRALAQPPHLVGFLILGGDQHDGNVRGIRIFADGAGGLETIEVGHHHVHQDQVGALTPGRFHARCAIFRGKRLVPELFDDALDAQQLRRRIVDDQDTCHKVEFPLLFRWILRRCRRASKRGAQAAAPMRTRVRPSDSPASMRSKTSGSCSSVTSRVAMRSRCCGFQSVARCCHTRSRMSRAVPAEAMPSRLAPRMMKGITVLSKPMPPALPQIATLP